ncbi:hypothetical protein IT157_03795 [bacterium]|nr:hypothetical protein [bacterium]
MHRVVLLLLVLIVSQAQAKRPSYAELFVGFASPFDLVAYQDFQSERVNPGSFATSLSMCGVFPVFGSLSLNPSFSMIATGGDVTNDPLPPGNFNVRFQQREIALDGLIQAPGLRRLHLGAGTSFAWWDASEDYARPLTERDYFVGRVIEGKSLLARGILHLALRNPEVSGASLKLVAAWPLNEILRINDSAATGYIGLHCGFSMILL